MGRKIPFAAGEYYHIYNRGVDKRVTFESDLDHKRFCMLLYLCNGDEPVRFERLQEWKGPTSPELIKKIFSEERKLPLVAIGAYCLMPNHFHLLLTEKKTNGISTFMQKLATAYTMYFNTSRDRTGALFQGRFKAQHLATDNHLKYIFSYIHLNPVKLIQSDWKDVGIKDIGEAKKLLSSYPYSSYFDYLGSDREFSKIIDRSPFPEYFPSRKDFEQEIMEWLTYV